MKKHASIRSLHDHLHAVATMSAPRPRATPSQEAIVRAVASSTAIETGQRIAEIETRLRHSVPCVPHITLALRHPAQPGRR